MNQLNAILAKAAAKPDKAISQNAVKDRTKANLIGVNGALTGGAAAVGGHTFARGLSDEIKYGSFHPDDAVKAAKAVKIARVVSGAGVAGAVGGAVYTGKKLRSANRHQKAMDASQAALRSAAEPQPIGKSDDLPGDNRNAQMARTRRKVGLGTAGAGYLALSRAKDVAPEAAALIAPSQRKVGAPARAMAIAAKGEKIRRVAGRGGALAIAGGLGLAAEGTLSDYRHRESFSRGHDNVKHVLKPKPESVADRAKAAVLQKVFDSERSRHNRQAAYTGVLGGGAVVAGAAGVKTGIDARHIGRLAASEARVGANAHEDVQARLNRMSPPPAARPKPGAAKPAAATPAAKPGPTLRARAADVRGAHLSAVKHGNKAVELAGKAKTLKRVSRGSLLGAAAAGAAAYGVHDYDRRHGGRSYDYGY